MEALKLGSIRTIQVKCQAAIGATSVINPSGNVLYVQACTGVLTFVNEEGQSIVLRQGDVKSFRYERLEITSTVASDAVSVDVGFGLIFPISSFPGASSSAPASVVASTAETFTGAISTITPTTNTFKFECPFSLLSLAGSFSLLNISMQPVGGGPSIGPTLYDLNGNIFASPNQGGTTTINGNGTQQEYYFDTTGIASVTIGTVSSGGGTFFLSSSHTTNSVFNSLPKKEITYTTSFNFVPAGSSTCFFYIPGVANLRVTLKKVRVYLGATTFTMGASLPVFKKLTALPTGGTAVTHTGRAFDSNFANAQSVPVHYTAAPSNGTGTPIRQAPLVSIASVGIIGTLQGFVEFNFDSNPNENEYILNGAAEGIEYNASGAVLTGGAMYVDLVWSEK